MIMVNKFLKGLNPMNKYPLILLAAFTISCNNPIKSNSSDVDKQSLEDKVQESGNLNLYHLPPILKEISGITFLNPDLILAIQDEKGSLYHYSLKKNEIVKEFEFGKSDDYEDLVRIDKDLYVVSSNGTIIQIKDFESAKPAIMKFKTVLTKENDIEGLGYEPQRNRLLLAAKANGMDQDKNTKEIYAFNLNTMKLEMTPAYTIKLDEIEAYFTGDALEESSKKFLKALGNRNMNKVFSSSAITVHPKNHKIFVLSSINNLIVVLSPDGAISEIIQFKGKEFKQPEGIAFSQEGKLFISNEAGKKGKGNIIEIEYAK